MSEDPAPELLPALPVSRDVELDPPKELGPELEPANVELELGAPNEVGPGLAELGVVAAGVLEGALDDWVAGRAFTPPGGAALRSLWQ